MKSIPKLILAAFAATALIPAAALAEDARNQGYLVDSSGNIVLSSTSGLCWHTSDWTPARAVEQCDPVIRPIAAPSPPQPKAAEVAAAPPAQIPQPQPAPPRPLPQKMSFSADALFAFDKSELKPEGKAMLDDLVLQLNGTAYDNILVTGHADRLGSAAYNQKLSERRANGVKTYLVGKEIAAGRIIAAGQGETQPVTKAGDCKGPQNAKLIACLQPDRRVDVEMTGTKTMAGSR